MKLGKFTFSTQSRFDTECCTIIEAGLSGYCECVKADGTTFHAGGLGCESRSNTHNCQEVCDSQTCVGCPGEPCVGAWSACPGSCDATERTWTTTSGPGPAGAACPVAGSAPQCEGGDGACAKGYTVQGTLILNFVRCPQACSLRTWPRSVTHPSSD